MVGGYFILFIGIAINGDVHKDTVTPKFAYVTEANCNKAMAPYRSIPKIQLGDNVFQVASVCKHSPTAGDIPREVHVNYD